MAEEQTTATLRASLGVAAGKREEGCWTGRAEQATGGTGGAKTGRVGVLTGEGGRCGGTERAGARRARWLRVWRERRGREGGGIKGAGSRPCARRGRARKRKEGEGVEVVVVAAGREGGRERGGRARAAACWAPRARVRPRTQTHPQARSAPGGPSVTRPPRRASPRKQARRARASCTRRRAVCGLLRRSQGVALRKQTGSSSRRAAQPSVGDSRRARAKQQHARRRAVPLLLQRAGPAGGQEDEHAACWLSAASLSLTPSPTAAGCCWLL